MAPPNDPWALSPARPGLDPNRLADQLTEDERAIADAAHACCQDRLQTRMLMAARHEKFDREIMNEAGAMG